ncbi:QXW lectin repeat family protein [Trichomonas vaginalis G3]|uniref:QXW lectin repeat family protein n=1 Tax=Trichomonas vaginalis (strain ATCC PRA-98 / G3) TaxID=412133 RepID=A2DUA7_TRIV3|nr:Ricin B-like lectins family [Trichomonas vaginalis G3]EAY15945.1 QXW lectin repeat family protein [Trichomonas vaginalis G3]KAI5523579.1 Ricin B-like lectins family [Trichomonas vaginalis G3]|eukprot:XP_001328168.1 QXW lectin repeat family protein [Trichomonas vaginalis G3]
MQVFILSAKHKEFAIGLDDGEAEHGKKAELKEVADKPTLKWLMYDRKIHTFPKRTLALEPKEDDGKVKLVLQDSDKIENKFYVYPDGSIRNKAGQAIDIEDSKFEPGADIVLKPYEAGKESQQWLLVTRLQ